MGLPTPFRVVFAWWVTACVAGLTGCSPAPRLDQMAASAPIEGTYAQILLRSPLPGTVFPADIAPYKFSWSDSSAARCWLVRFDLPGTTAPLLFLAKTTNWTPTAKDWTAFKQASTTNVAKVTLFGFADSRPGTPLSKATLSLTTSPDPVAAPIFYREVNLPFMEAVKDPSKIRWRFGSVDSAEPPPVVLTGLPVCGNCHSFSQDGSVLGMDVDYANDKGSYILTRVGKEMTLTSSNVLTWSSYQREDGVQTFGLLSQVSPDGRYVVSTVKDKSVFVATPDLEFSQLFFPIKGILAYYERGDRSFHALPGADDTNYVQSNPTWSPDGKEILFARAEAYQLKNRDAEGKVLLSPEECAEFLKDGKILQFDLYRMPFNEGRGGTPVPIRGASKNGKSNYFPKFSPDGKWIVFCQSRSFMLLQPDSELYIMPAAGGEPRRLQCNTARMNSWHSWSPNGKWLVFSSKVNGPYTQLFLTHINDAGEDTPAVLLEHFTRTNGAANIPEFVNTKPGAIEQIKEQFLDDYNHARMAYVMEVNGDVDGAMAEYATALRINPRNVNAHQRLGFLLFHSKRQFKQGLEHTMEALRLDPNDGCAHYDLGMALQYQGQTEQAIQHFSRAVKLLPAGFDRRYNPVDMQWSLANALLANGNAPESEQLLVKTLTLNPTNAPTYYLLAMAGAAQGKKEDSLRHYAYVVQHQPALDTSADLHLLFASNYAKDGEFDKAAGAARKALQLASAGKDRELIGLISGQLREYEAAARGEPTH